MSKSFLPFVFAALLSAGCAAFRSREAPAADAGALPHVDRDRLSEALSGSFSSDGRFAGVTISLDSRREGVVTLKGEVADRQQAADAGRLAASARGVRVVYNLLDVERPAARAKAARWRKSAEIVAETR